MAPVLPTAVAEAPPRTETRSGLPKALELSRYTALGKKSPFTLASATAEADFAKELVLGGYVRLEGEDYVTQDLCIRLLADEEEHLVQFKGFLKEYTSG